MRMIRISNHDRTMGPHSKPGYIRGWLDDFTGAGRSLQRGSLYVESAISNLRKCPKSGSIAEIADAVECSNAKALRENSKYPMIRYEVGANEIDLAFIEGKNRLGLNIEYKPIGYEYVCTRSFKTTLFREGPMPVQPYIAELDMRFGHIVWQALGLGYPNKAELRRLLEAGLLKIRTWNDENDK